MFRPIRKKSNEIGLDEAKKLLAEAPRGILAVNGDDGYPYAFPINYFYDEEAGKIYFHGARAGYKAEALKKCDKICFTAYGNETYREGDWAPFTSSVVVFGRCRIIEDTGSAMRNIKRFAMKYFPTEEEVDAEIAKSGKAVGMYEIDIEHMSGKRVHER